MRITLIVILNINRVIYLLCKKGTELNIYIYCWTYDIFKGRNISDLLHFYVPGNRNFATKGFIDDKLIYA